MLWIKVSLILALLAICVLGQGNDKGKNKNKSDDKKKKPVLKPHMDADRIINGVNATIEEFPELVQLVQLDRRIHVCGGFLVTDRHVVTAAHCVAGGAGDGNFLRVFANATYTKHGGIERAIEDFYVPDEFDEVSRAWDVAVIKLKEPFPLGPGIKVAKLCDASWDQGPRIRIAGWGNTHRKGNKAERLMSTTVQTISDKQCTKRLASIQREADEELFFVTETTSCALPKGHFDACQGDSGGPAYIGEKVCGIVSFGFECGRGKFPSLYTSVAKARKFIDESLQK